MSTALRELEEQYGAKLKFVEKIFREATQSDGNIDLRKSEALRNMADDGAARLYMKEVEAELKDLFEKKAALKEILDQNERMIQLIRENDEIDPKDHHVHGAASTALATKDAGLSLGQLCARDWYKGTGHRDVWLNKDYTDYEVKAVLTTATTWLPEVTRTGRVAEFASRPIQVIDQFPVGTTNQAAVAYMEEVSRTNTAAEVAEGGAMPQSEFAFVEKTVNVKKIATYMTVTDEQLADVAQMQGLIDQRLRLFVQQRLDLQVLQGNGVGPNILGLLNTPSILTYARGAETNFDAIFRGMAQVQVTGRANTSGILIHPTNWTTIRLATANGLYIFGPPTDAGVARLWGVPVSVTDIIPAGTAVVGDFSAHSQLVTRQGVEVLAGFVQDDFIKGQSSVRATLRAALVIYRPTAFSTITNLN